MQSDAKKNVAIVKPASSTRDSIRLLCQKRRADAHVFDDAEQLLSSDRRTTMHCVVSDLELANMDGLTLLESLRFQGLGMPVIFVSAQADVPTTVQAMHAGALTVLLEPIDNYQIQCALDTALQRTPVRQAPTYRVDPAHITDADPLLDKLTHAEYEVLDRIAMGKPNKTVAKELSISLRTVEDRRRRIYAKLGVSSLAAMMEVAIGRKYVSRLHAGTG